MTNRPRFCAVSVLYFTGTYAFFVRGRRQIECKDEWALVRLVGVSLGPFDSGGAACSPGRGQCVALLVRMDVMDNVERVVDDG